MDIYLIEHDEWCYDSYGSHVIIAKDKDTVIGLAKAISADEGEYVWSDSRVINVGKYTGDKTEPFVLLSNFRAG